MLCTESITALAAEAADDKPLASITFAPRVWTSLMNSFFNHPWSVITSKTAVPAIRAFRASGYWVAEWLPQIAMFETTLTGTFAFFASWILARFSSRRVIANHLSAGISGAFERAM